MRQLRWASQPLTMANIEPRMMLGNRRLSKDDWTAMLMVLDAIDGDIPAVRKAAQKLWRSGKGVEEAVAAVKDRQYSGRGPLHMAAWAGRLEMCKFLVKDLRLNVDAPGDEGSTPLLFAIFGCGSTSVIRFLLDHGANPNKAAAEGFLLRSIMLHKQQLNRSPGTDTDAEEAGGRMWAANTRDTCEIAELLLSRGAYVDPMCRRGTPLHIAAQSGNVRMVELLLRHQANAGADANAGRPFQPLVIAAAHGFIDFINCLLEAGADPNVPGQCGRTPAEIAVVGGWMDCAEILSPLTSAGIHDPVFGEHDGWALKEQEDAALEENRGFALKMQEGATFESMVLKMQGDAAFEENAYAYALALYTKAMEADPDDSTLYAKRSLCWLHLSEEDTALDDANTYKAMEMDLSNSCYEQAAALVLTKEYAQACQALMSGLKLDLRSDDLD
ncbi:hypothetical protein QYE76_071396 [Lolium multiflorum]|uniref:Serine/threonine-protein kinase BSK1-like TPR repeats domain-containing protein n=1 Tax=Lolium multiflorum TaxID=4521 RepID=A0AAD8SLI2_LOLMU|nr:hypothetical protein QYE76_071396 [Lolium multiflorum]